MTDSQIVDMILNPKLTREKYIELRQKGHTNKQIGEQYSLKNISTKISYWGLGGWRAGMDVPDKPKTNKDTSASNTDTNKDQFTDVNQMVEHPPHYTAGKVECIDAIESAVTGLSPQEAVHVANILKYVWRYKHKNGKQDLQKAIWYLNRLMEMQQ